MHCRRWDAVWLRICARWEICNRAAARTPNSSYQAAIRGKIRSFSFEPGLISLKSWTLPDFSLTHGPTRS
jgi:hypothetical protein